MKKIIVSIGLYCISIGVSAQMKYSPKPTLKSESAARKLKIDEINFVSSYYQQDGNHSAVTGGVGTEYLYDIANSIDLKLSLTDHRNRTHTLVADASFDYYSSASSDNIDDRSLSSASMTDLHIYPTLSYSRKDENTNETIGASLSYSTEYDYISKGGSVSYAKAINNNNTEFTVKLGTFFDTWMAILPYELRPVDYGSGSHGDQQNMDFKKRNTYNIALGVSQVFSQRLQMMFMIEPTYQEGLLSTPYHRVYFTDNTLKVEKLPGTRLKLPMSVRGSYFLGDNIIIKAFYRYFADDWGMKAHTVSIETPIKINSFFSFTPHYRFNSQSAVRYFAPNKSHVLTDAYYTSDYDISKFNSGFWGAGLRITPPGGILGIRWWNSAELRYGHYNRTDGMVANIISLTTKVK